MPILAGIIVFWWGVYQLGWKRITLPGLVAVCFFLAVMTNGLQGVDEGFVKPITGHPRDTASYYGDAQSVRSAGNLLQHYTDVQPFLRNHSRVHPPGPVLFFYSFIALGVPAWLVSVILLAAGMSSLIIFYFLLARFHYPESLRLFVVGILGLIPATQIYFLAVIDSLIVCLFALSLWAFWSIRSRTGVWLTAVLVSTAMLFSFAAVWLLAVMAVTEFWEQKKLSRFAQVLAISVGIYWLLYAVSGYNYWQSFMIAKYYEGPTEFYLLADFKSYLSTRVEDIIEILLFAGPLVCWWFFRGLLLKQVSSPQWRAGVSGWLMFGGFIGMGAYFSGETARAAAYMYVPLLLVAAEWIKTRKPGYDEQFLWLTLILGQTVLMQLFGWYVF